MAISRRRSLLQPTRIITIVRNFHIIRVLFDSSTPPLDTQPDDHWKGGGGGEGLLVKCIEEEIYRRIVSNWMTIVVLSLSLHSSESTILPRRVDIVDAMWPEVSVEWMGFVLWNVTRCSKCTFVNLASFSSPLALQQLNMRALLDRNYWHRRPTTAINLDARHQGRMHERPKRTIVRGGI